MTYRSRADLSDRIRKQAVALLQASLSDALDLEAHLLDDRGLLTLSRNGGT